ncbi:MAG: sigma-70 family RNA polymerase sigma factor [Anaerolineales bacterium]
MLPNESPRRPSLQELQERCAEETLKYLFGVREEAWNCYEVFRRALVERSNEAWAVLYEQYYAQVKRWVQQHPMFSNFQEEADFFVNLALEKFWRRNFSASDFAQFQNVKKLLAYVKMCVGSVIMDYGREKKGKIEALYLDDAIPTSSGGGTSYQQTVEDQLIQEEFWQKVQMNLEDDLMFRVVYDSFVLGLKPVEILNLPPKVFKDVQEIYKIKAKALHILARVLQEMNDF